MLGLAAMGIAQARASNHNRLRGLSVLAGASSGAVGVRAGGAAPSASPVSCLPARAQMTSVSLVECGGS
jgi:hypothetical protein